MVIIAVGVGVNGLVARNLLQDNATEEVLRSLLGMQAEELRQLRQRHVI